MGDYTRRLQVIDGGILPLVRDQLGRELAPGASVMLPAMESKGMIWQIENVRPNLHPQAPPNTVLIGVVMRAQLVVPKGAAVLEIIRVAEPITLPGGAAGVAEDLPRSSDDLTAQNAIEGSVNGHAHDGGDGD
jgi:hypothetical protein